MPRILLVTLAVLVLAACSTAPAQESFFVAPDGNDQWSGRLKTPNAERTDGPFATPARAQEAVRKLREGQAAPRVPVTVQIRGGTYFLKDRKSVV
jgi:hypothetical protein